MTARLRVPLNTACAKRNRGCGRLDQRHDPVAQPLGKAATTTRQRTAPISSPQF
jgi:hypothetical protein